MSGKWQKRPLVSGSDSDSDSGSGSDAGSGIDAPVQQKMVQQKMETLLGDKNGLLVKQTMRGCCQECMGCEAKSEFNIAKMEHDWMDGYKLKAAAQNQEDIMYALEESSFCCRCCWRDGRPFDMVVSEGAEKGGQELMHFVKPCSFPLYFSVPIRDGCSVNCPFCCFLPKLSTTLPGGTPLGNEAAYICDQNCCVPKLQYSENGQPVYILKPETCCGGCCIACDCSSGNGCWYIPFYFHDPESGDVVGGDYNGKYTPQIRKLWAGLTKECCSTADTFALMFPPGIDTNRKAGLLGLTFLLDFTVFERQQDIAE